MTVLGTIFFAQHMNFLYIDLCDFMFLFLSVKLQTPLVDIVYANLPGLFSFPCLLLSDLTPSPSGHKQSTGT